MSHSKYLDNLTADEKNALRAKLWGIQNHKCFICEKEIDLDLNSVNIDHIKPLANGGKDEEQNFALTHESCNKKKQDADLFVAKKLCQLEEIINNANTNKEIPSLKHVLLARGGSKYDFRYKVEGNTLVYSFDDIEDPTARRTEIFEDELSGEKTAFIRVPLQYIFHDELINPRGINSSISLLIKEFYKTNPQLHLSLARIDQKKIKIFDGQHKAVAQIMLDAKSIVVRLFLDPNVERLTETNTNAGSKLKQIAFDKAIVRQLHDALYAERLKRYQIDHSLTEDDYSFSEKNVVDHFKGSVKSIKTYVVNSQKNAITRSPDNKLQGYMSFEGRDASLPLSYSTFEKTLLAEFINSKTILTKPINYKMEEGLNPRILEQKQIINLCNIIAEEILVGKFDNNIGVYKIESRITAGNGDDIPDDHLIASRLLREEVMKIWIECIRRIIVAHFSFAGTEYDSENLFQQKFPDQLWNNIRNFMNNLKMLPVWKDRSMSDTIFASKRNYDYWKTIFNTGKTNDGVTVLAKPVNTMEMIKK